MRADSHNSRTTQSLSDDQQVRYEELAARLERALHEHLSRAHPAMERLWSYYRNPEDGERPVRGRITRAGLPAQAAGLPERLLSTRASGDRGVRREVVIENDIAWRVQTMVDFVFGKPVRLRSEASDAARRASVERALGRLWRRAGGLGFLQDFATLGHVFGHCDLLLRCDETALLAIGAEMKAAIEAGDEEAQRRLLGEAIDACAIELIDPRRGVAIVSPHDYREIEGYLIVSEGGAGEHEPVRERSFLDRVLGRGERSTREIDGMETILPGLWRIERGGETVLAKAGLLSAGVPIVHVQNVSQPFAFWGIGEVEPLLGLQDELNTRLSDRANRVTLQSFRMYLARGIEGMDKVGVGPGQVWYTDNPEASVQVFGGDGATPGEEAHIQEVRDALDKVSGVPPIAGGVAQGKVGNLTSANALRITLVGLLAKNERKRLNYGRGIARLSELVLETLHEAGVLDVPAEERGVAVVFAEPLGIEDSGQAAIVEGVEVR